MRTAAAVALTAMGFGTGERWAGVHAYFERAWDVVLGQLQKTLGSTAAAGGE